MKENGFSLNRTLGLAIALIGVIAVLGSGGVLLTLSQLQDATASRFRSAQIISELSAFETAMINQETGIRGYLLTSKRTSLEPYEMGRTTLDRTIGELKRLIDKDEEQLHGLQVAEKAARDWQHQIGTAIVRDMADLATRDRARAIEASGAGKALFDAFRAHLAIIEQRERRSLGEQSRLVENAQRMAMFTLWASLIATLVISVGAGLALSRYVTRPLVVLADTMRRLVRRDTSVPIPSLAQRNEVGAMARAVEVFKNSLVELDRTSVLRVTADTMPAMIAYIDADRTVGFLNEEFARRFSITSDDVTNVSGRNLDQLFPQRTFPGAGDELAMAMGGEEVRFAFQMTQDISPRDYEGYFRPHRAPQGRVLGVVALFTDVTDRKQIDLTLRHQAHDLQRSNAELEQFAYVASHDLKAPLRGIENLASWIEEDLGDKLEGDTRTNMDLLKSRVRRLESLLSDLLAYSRAGRDDTVVREIDTRTLVVDLAALISPPDGFRIEGHPDLPTLRAPQAALTQTLQNLIGNAVKHHPDPAHGIVEVKAMRLGNMYEFQVSDNGPGIPEQFRERVFGMFQTLKPRDEVEGSGMGLAIVKKLVERQSGQVWLSEGEAGGLIVHFTWPVIPKEI
jgi:signal transduction histidine kinase/CHASE3 domain sensor protein